VEATATPRRLDALRNDERIDSGALQELGRNPAAGMEEIAAACGVSRATLFRRYPSRDDLLGVLRERAHDDLSEAVRSADIGSGTATEALDRLIDALVEASVPYAFLLSNPAPEHREGEFLTPSLSRLIKRGQKSGEFSTDAPARWWADAIIALLQVGTRSSKRKREIARLIKATAIDGLGLG
jgi:TetR/AcrR family transcriptional regulator, mexCD-oprJ operon repressor